jgi:hypothetical protein
VEVQRPTPITGAASLIGATSATLNGSATPGESSATAHFEYGSTTSYGHVTADEPVANVTSPTPISSAITSLTSGTVVHYRLVATGPYGTTAGADKTFTTLALPVNTKRPRISGKARVGKTLTCSRGSWSGQPTAFAYAWKRNGKTIKGANRSKHRVKRKDAGRKLRCTVTAKNAAGTGSATSNAVSPKRPKSHRTKR